MDVAFIENADARPPSAAPATLNSSFQRYRAGVPAIARHRAAADRGGAGRGYLILGIFYESYIHPLTVLSTLPSAGVGALALLMLCGFDFSLIALIGIILLIGIVKKNGIMMVDFGASSVERDEHLSPEAVDPQGRAAALPSDHDDHDGGDARRRAVDVRPWHRFGVRQPLGYAMVGGLFVSQALTLFTTPVVYLYLDNLSNALSRWSRSGKPGTPAGEEHFLQKHAAE